MIASFAVYFFNRRTAGISCDFAGKYLSLTQLINVSLPSMLPPITFSFISIPVDKSLQVVLFPFILFSCFLQRGEAERFFFSFEFFYLEVCYFRKEDVFPSSREGSFYFAL